MYRHPKIISALAPPSSPYFCDISGVVTSILNVNMAVSFSFEKGVDSTHGRKLALSKDEAIALQAIFSAPIQVSVRDILDFCRKEYPGCQILLTGSTVELLRTRALPLESVGDLDFLIKLDAPVAELIPNIVIQLAVAKLGLSLTQSLKEKALIIAQSQRSSSVYSSDLNPYVPGQEFGASQSVHMECKGSFETGQRCSVGFSILSGPQTAPNYYTASRAVAMDMSQCVDGADFLEVPLVCLLSESHGATPSEVLQTCESFRLHRKLYAWDTASIEGADVRAAILEAKEGYTPLTASHDQVLASHTIKLFQAPQGQKLTIQKWKRAFENHLSSHEDRLKAVQKWMARLHRWTKDTSPCLQMAVDVARALFPSHSLSEFLAEFFTPSFEQEGIPYSKHQISEMVLDAHYLTPSLDVFTHRAIICETGKFIPQLFQRLAVGSLGSLHSYLSLLATYISCVKAEGKEFNLRDIGVAKLIDPSHSIQDQFKTYCLYYEIFENQLPTPFSHLDYLYQLKLGRTPEVPDSFELSPSHTQEVLDVAIPFLASLLVGAEGFAKHYMALLKCTDVPLKDAICSLKETVKLPFSFIRMCQEFATWVKDNVETPSAQLNSLNDIVEVCLLSPADLSGNDGYFVYVYTQILTSPVLKDLTPLDTKSTFQTLLSLSERLSIQDLKKLLFKLMLKLSSEQIESELPLSEDLQRRYSAIILSVFPEDQSKDTFPKLAVMIRQLARFGLSFLPLFDRLKPYSCDQHIQLFSFLLDPKPALEFDFTPFLTQYRPLVISKIIETYHKAMTSFSFEDTYSKLSPFFQSIFPDLKAGLPPRVIWHHLLVCSPPHSSLCLEYESKYRLELAFAYSTSGDAAESAHLLDGVASLDSMTSLYKQATNDAQRLLFISHLWPQVRDVESAYSLISTCNFRGKDLESILRHPHTAEILSDLSQPFSLKLIQFFAKTFPLHADVYPFLEKIEPLDIPLAYFSNPTKDTPIHMAKLLSCLARERLSPDSRAHCDVHDLKKTTLKFMTLFASVLSAEDVYALSSILQIPPVTFERDSQRIQLLALSPLPPMGLMVEREIFSLISRFPLELFALLSSKKLHSYSLTPDHQRALFKELIKKHATPLCVLSQFPKVFPDAFQGAPVDARLATQIATWLFNMLDQASFKDQHSIVSRALCDAITFFPQNIWKTSYSHEKFPLFVAIFQFSTLEFVQKLSALYPTFLDVGYSWVNPSGQWVTEFLITFGLTALSLSEENLVKKKPTAQEKSDFDLRRRTLFSIAKYLIQFHEASQLSLRSASGCLWAVHFAKYGDIEGLRLLRDKGVDFHLSDVEGLNVVSQAISSIHMDERTRINLVHFLVNESNCDFCVPDKSGFFPLTRLVREVLYLHRELPSLEDTLFKAVLPLILPKSKDIILRGTKSFPASPLHLAASHFSWPLTSLFLDTLFCEPNPAFLEGLHPSNYSLEHMVIDFLTAEHSRSMRPSTKLTFIKALFSYLKSKEFLRVDCLLEANPKSLLTKLILLNFELSKLIPFLIDDIGISPDSPPLETRTSPLTALITTRKDLLKSGMELTVFNELLEKLLIGNTPNYDQFLSRLTRVLDDDFSGFSLFFKAVFFTCWEVIFDVDTKYFEGRFKSEQKEWINTQLDYLKKATFKVHPTAQKPSFLALTDDGAIFFIPATERIADANATISTTLVNLDKSLSLS